MVMNINEVRQGKTLNIDGQLHTVLEYSHNKTARGSAVIKLKLKNILTGAITEKSYRSGEKVDDVRLEGRSMQYLYKDGDSYIFMDNETFEQIPVEQSALGDSINYLVDNMEIELQMYEGQVMGVNLPTSVILKVVETEPGFKGDTVNNVTKSAILETGFEVQVPVFVNQDEQIKVDTRSGAYIERA